MSRSVATVERNSKFTRGEKCLFAHIVITFCLIIAIIIGYYGHACLVRHRGNLGVNLGRRSGAQPQVAEHRCVGAVYVRAETERVACAAALLAPTWSLVPARCVAARSRPELAHLLPHWTIRYQVNTTGIRRGIPHPKYNADDAANDVGLFEHETQFEPLAPFCTVPRTELNDDLLSEDNLQIVGWHYDGGVSVSHVHGASSARCTQFTAPVTERRAAAACVSAHTAQYTAARHLLHGVLFASMQMVALASWGNGVENFPLVVIDIAPFKDWLNLTMTPSFV